MDFGVDSKMLWRLTKVRFMAVGLIGKSRGMTELRISGVKDGQAYSAEMASFYCDRT
jgi:hypothetical protein